MVNKEIEIIWWIFYYITIALIIFVAWMLILKLTGHSPTDTSVILWALGIIGTFQILSLTLLFQMKSEIGSTKEKVGGLLEFKRQTIERIKGIEEKM